MHLFCFDVLLILRQVLFEQVRNKVFTSVMILLCLIVYMLLIIFMLLEMHVFSQLCFVVFLFKCSGGGQMPDVKPFTKQMEICLHS